MINDFPTQVRARRQEIDRAPRRISRRRAVARPPMAQVFGFVGPVQEDTGVKTTWDKVYGLAKDFGSYVLRNAIRPAF